jgi:hypothetical protein
MKISVQHIYIENCSVVTKHNRLCSAGQRDIVKNLSGRIVIFTSYMTSLVILAGYSASLISSLAVERRHLPFRDLQGLLYDGSYKLGIQSHTSMLDLFKV